MRTVRSSSSRGGSPHPMARSPWTSPSGVGLDWIPLKFPLGVGLDQIPLNFPLGCGPADLPFGTRSRPPGTRSRTPPDQEQTPPWDQATHGTRPGTSQTRPPPGPGTPPCGQISWHTLVKILPCPKLRLRAVKIEKYEVSYITFDGWFGNVSVAIISVTIQIIHPVCVQVSYRQTYKSFKSLL